MIHTHAGRWYSGTTADRTAFSPDKEGTLFHDTDEGVVYWWDGASWQSFGSGGSPGSIASIFENHAGPFRYTITTAGYSAQPANPTGIRGVGTISSVNINSKEYQVYSYYNSAGFIVIAVRKIPDAWVAYTTTIQFQPAGDDHNIISTGLDSNGYIHISYDEHLVPLKYRKSTLPIDQFDGTLTTTLSMLGAHETSVTYPTFFTDPHGELYFIFRSGQAGLGDAYFYHYSLASSTWEAAAGTGTQGKLLDGLSDSSSPYWIDPAFDADFGSGGYMHLFWTWLPDVSREYPYIGYAAWDGNSWVKSDGSAQTVPIRQTNDEEVDDLGDSLIQISLLHQGAYSDSNGRPCLAYFRDELNDTYVMYFLYYDGATWVKIGVPSEPTTPANGFGMPILVIDRTLDVAIIIYTDHGEGNSMIYMLTSRPGDYYSWDKRTLYPNETDATGFPWYQPKYDARQWNIRHRLYIPIETWPGFGGANLPIYLLEYMPTDWATWNPETYPLLHANDIDSNTTSIHHTLGSGSYQAAAGDHSHGGPVGTAFTDLTDVPGSYTGKGGMSVVVKIGEDGLEFTANASRSEVIMQDGVSNPPVPVTNEDGTDWVYSG